MKKHLLHITSIFFMVVFMLNGLGSLMHLLSIDTEKQSVVELLTKTESENSGKEKEEKVSEKEWFQHVTDIDFPRLIIIDSNINCSGYSLHWDNVFLSIFTPPPEFH